MKRTQSIRKTIFLAMLAGMMLVSCVPQKQMLILQSADKNDTTNQFNNDRSIFYKIQPGDNLYIRVISLDEKTAMMFNPGGSANSQIYSTDASIYLNSYTVSEQGTIEFPLAGQIYIQNLSVEEVKTRLQEILDQYIKETVLVVKLVNFNLTILGEVRNPGQYKVYKTEINILEAISMAGDLGNFANRNEVTIVRQTKTGSETFVVDLASSNILGSDFYYLKPTTSSM